MKKIIALLSALLMGATVLVATATPASAAYSYGWAATKSTVLVNEARHYVRMRIRFRVTYNGGVPEVARPNIVFACYTRPNFGGPLSGAGDCSKGIGQVVVRRAGPGLDGVVRELEYTPGPNDPSGATYAWTGGMVFPHCGHDYRVAARGIRVRVNGTLYTADERTSGRWYAECWPRG